MMPDQGSPRFELEGHPNFLLSIDVHWRRVEIEGPFGGFYVPGSDPSEIGSILSGIPDEVRGSTRLLGTNEGTFVLLLSGEIHRELGARPLKRVGNGPFLFHPADAAPVPALPPEALRQALAGGHLAGRVRRGTLDWIRAGDPGLSSPASALALGKPVQTFKGRSIPPEGDLDRAFREFPQFAPERLPEAGTVGTEVEQTLKAVPEPRPSFFSRLFRKGRPPSGIDWADLKRPPPWSLRRALESFWAWVDKDRSPGPGTPVGKFIRRVFDPGQWKVTAGLVQSLRERHARMLDRLAKLFERGDLDLALKHSIPIDSELAKSPTDWGFPTIGTRLPERRVAFSLDDLRDRPPGRPGGAILGGKDQIERLSTYYRRAADELAKSGRHRESAYVYAHLLKDYASAARELERGHFHLEAAALITEKLKNKSMAAEVLERGGYAVEAVRLYLEIGAFEAAAGACERAGMEEERKKCIELWVADLKRRGRRLEAGDLLRERLGRPGDAGALYREEFEFPRGLRGEAGGRLADLGWESDPGDLGAWAGLESSLVREIAGGDFDSAVRTLVTFHREAGERAKERPLPAETRSALFRKTRASLMTLVREAQRRRRTAVRGEAVTLLSEILGDGRDPLAVLDLRKGLEIPASTREGDRSSRGRIAAGFRALENRGVFCWVGRDLGWTDEGGIERFGPLPMGHLPRDLAVHPETVGGGIRIGVVTHDQRFVLARLENGKMVPIGTMPLPGALSVAPRPGGSFLVGTQEGTLVEMEPDQSTAGVRTSRFIRGEGPLGFLSVLEFGRLTIGGGPRADLDVFDSDEGSPEVMTLPSPVGAVEHVHARGGAAILLGESGSFGLIQRKEALLVSLVEAKEVHGVTCLSLSEASPGEGDRRVVTGKADGEIVIHVLRIRERPVLRHRATVRTTLGTIAAAYDLGPAGIMAVDTDFNVAVLDSERLEVVGQGKWARP